MDDKKRNEPNHTHPSRKRTEKVSSQTRPWLKWLGWGLLIVIAVLGIFAVKMYTDIDRTTNRIFSDVESEDIVRNRVDLAEGEEAFSVLLLGTDEGYIYDRDGGRSDTIIVATVNPKTKKVTMTSIPRDTYLWIPGHGMDKVNHAYMEGGVELAIKTLQIYLDIPIDYYVKVNMEAVIDLVDSIGGINITPKLDFSESGHNFYAGQRTHLDGEKALAYARMRKYDPRGDYGRQERQQELILAVVEELLSFSTFFEYQSILKSVEDNIQTNLTLNDMFNIFNNYRQAARHIDSFQLEGYTEIIDGVYYEIIPEENVLELQERLDYELGLDKSLNPPTVDDMPTRNKSEEYDNSTYEGYPSSSDTFEDESNLYYPPAGFDQNQNQDLPPQEAPYEEDSSYLEEPYQEPAIEEPPLE